MTQMHCRVLDLPYKNALDNTAFDQFLLQGASQGQLTLAFTQWHPSVLIGNSQSLNLDVDTEACQQNRVGIMRRFSGGQAVYLDENYIVFTISGPRSCFPVSLDDLRAQICEAMVKALKKFGVPAIFFKPDNLVITSPSVRTLGNSGQVIKRDAVLAQGSIRYDLTDKGLETMLAVLKTNGQSLQDFFDPCKKALASVREFTDISPNKIKDGLIEEIAAVYGCESYYEGTLNLAEHLRIEELAALLLSDMRLEDKPTYQSRGVCYFYLNGHCIVPEIAHFLPKVKPSTHLDSTIV